MSFVDLKTLVDQYLDGFNQNVLFRAKLIQNSLTFRKQYIYFGQNVGEMRHGSYGICFSFASNENLMIYEGSWVNDQYNGKGSLFTIPKMNANRVCRWLEGQWKNGKLNGMGLIKVFQEGSKNWKILYQGSFIEDHKHGYGIQYFNGNVYQGIFFKGTREGNGRLTDTLGNFYDGNFHKGFPQGQGLQRKGPQITINNSNGIAKIFQLPNNKEKLSKFTLNIIRMI